MPLFLANVLGVAPSVIGLIEGCVYEQGQVTLDSGDVLMGPRGGRWWPRPGFLETLAAERPGADLSGFTQRQLDAIALRLNTRPRDYISGPVPATPRTDHG